MSNTADRNRVPATTRHSGKIIELSHGLRFRVVTASHMDEARDAANFAAVTGSVGNESYMYECAGPTVMSEQRAIERWAIVERIDAEGRAIQPL